MANERAYRALLSVARSSRLGRSARRDLRIHDRSILMHERAPDRFIWLHTRYRTGIYDPRMRNVVEVFAHEAVIQESRQYSDDLKQFYYAWSGTTLTACTHQGALDLLAAWYEPDPEITLKLFGLSTRDGIIEHDHDGTGGTSRGGSRLLE